MLPSRVNQTLLIAVSDFDQRPTIHNSLSTSSSVFSTLSVHTSTASVWFRIQDTCQSYQAAVSRKRSSMSFCGYGSLTKKTSVLSVSYEDHFVANTAKDVAAA